MEQLQVQNNQEAPVHECMTCGEHLHVIYPVYECERCLNQSAE
ncbi:hypothetical protein [Tumebacillus amylolyticus]|nr:hypothetical protein [Tumebacillus amylolyticus]